MSDRMITICSPQYGLSDTEPAGGTVHDVQILKGLADSGYQIEIILPHGKSTGKARARWNITNLRIPYIHLTYLFNLTLLPALFRTYRRTDFQVLRVHSPYLTGIGCYLFKRFVAPNLLLIATYHHLENRFLHRLIDRVLIHRYDHIFTVSEYTKRALIEQYGVSADTITVIWNGVAQEYFDIVRHPHTDTKMRLVYCGLLIKRKNLSFLLRALHHARLSNAHLTIIGEGPERNKLETLAQDLHITNCITFAGTVADDTKKRILAESDLFVFPSRMEGFGLAVAEAMAAGLPVLTSNCGALPEVVQNGGAVVPLDRDMWATALQHLSQVQPDRERYATQARRIAKAYRWEAVTKRTDDALRTLLQNV